jgi:hypothetical protein
MESMGRTTRYAPEVRERAVRLVFDHEREYDSQWATMRSIAEKIGCTGETLRTDFVLDALEQALYDRPHDDATALVHHSDRGGQHLSIRYSERLAEAAIDPSVGSRGDAYDNALAESAIGRYKTEVIRRRGRV